jgi:type IV secretory pathway VirB9-like protein
MPTVFAMTLLAMSAMMSASAVVSQDHQRSAPIPSPSDNRIVTLVYEKDSSYVIPTLVGMDTHIRLGNDETLQFPQAADAVQFVIKTDSDQGRNIWVKPIRPDLSTTLTLITDKRTYYLVLQSGPEGAKWYRAVSWVYPDVQVAKRFEAERAEQVKAEEAKRSDEQKILKNIDFGAMNWRYEIEGDAAFRPTSVFDNGQFVHLILPNAIQRLPSVFLREADGQGSLVAPSLSNEVLIIPRLAPQIILKLDKEIVTITRRDARMKRPWFNLPRDNDYGN